MHQCGNLRSVVNGEGYQAGVVKGYSVLGWCGQWRQDTRLVCSGILVSSSETMYQTGVIK